MIASPATWIVVPLLGAVIGYATNRIAVRMLFRPVEPVNVLGFRVQGLLGRRQKDLARSIGRVVGDHLVQHDEILRGLSALDLEALLGAALDRGIAAKVDGLRNLPLVGSFLTDERVKDLRDSIARGILKEKEPIFEAIERAIEEGLDVRALVEEKVAAFPVLKLESLVLEVAARELRAIEVLGGLLGLLIGVLQVVALSFL
jgi:uncharacterized membrane protein YheB (UPF0754 family)